jgi:SAM-dependent methyltransferase
MVPFDWRLRTMNTPPVCDTWEQGNPYEQYIGRWSRRVAPLFLSWLDLPAGKAWVDVGCGTGALSAAILDQCSPASLVGIEPSEGFLQLAVQNLGSRARLLPGSAGKMPLTDRACDVVVSGLVLNFIPDLPSALAEMIRVASPGGTIAAYVWDYGEKMEVIRHFWDVAVSLDPAAAALHEAARFPLCHPAALRTAFESAGLADVDTTPIDVAAQFADFEDYWRPFLGGQGPAPAYVASLSDTQRAALKAALQARLPASREGIVLNARAWAVRGTTPLDG